MGVVESGVRGAGVVDGCKKRSWLGLGCSSCGGMGGGVVGICACRNRGGRKLSPLKGISFVGERENTEKAEKSSHLSGESRLTFSGVPSSPDAALLTVAGCG